MSSNNIFALSSYKLAQYLIYAAFVTPMLVAVSLFFPFITLKVIYFRVVVELALLFFIFFALGDPKMAMRILRPIVKHPLFIAVSVFVATMVLVSITGINFLYSFFSNFERGDGTFQMLHLYVFFGLLLALFPGKKDWMKLLKFSLGVSAIIALYAIGQKYQAHPQLADLIRQLGIIGDSTRPPGPLGNPSYLSVYSMFHFLFALFVIHRESRIGSRVMWLLVVVLNLFVFFNAQTRGTILGLAAALFIALVILSFTNWRPQRQVEGGLSWVRNNPRQLFSILLVLFILSGVFFVATRTSLSFWQEIPGINRFATEELFNPLEDSSFRSRYLTWTSAFAGFMEKPILGWGPENFPVVFDKYYNPLRFGSESWFDRAHNFILDYLVTGGVVFLATFVGMFYVYYLALIRSVRRLEHADGSPPERAFFAFLGKTPAAEKLGVYPEIKKPYFLYVGFLVLPIAYLVQNLFLFDVLSIYIVLFTLFAFSVHIANDFEMIPGWQELTENRYSYAPFAYVCAAMLAVAVGASLYWTGYVPYQKNVHIRKAMAAMTQNPIDGFAAFKDALDYYSPVGQAETVEQTGSYMTNYFGQLLQNNRRLKPEAAPLTIDFANEVYDYAERDGHVLSAKATFLYGIANLQAGILFNDRTYLERARDLMLEGREVSPTRFEFIFGLSDVALQLGDDELLAQMVKRARELRPDLEDRIKRYEDALEQMRAAQASTATETP